MMVAIWGHNYGCSSRSWQFSCSQHFVEWQKVGFILLGSLRDTNEYRQNNEKVRGRGYFSNFFKKNICFQK
jgi:hypothetical protein